MDNTRDVKVYSEISTLFPSDIVKEAIKSKFSNPRNKISEDSVELIGEISKALTVEAALRSGKMATKENKITVTLQHVEMILPQLMLDFP